MLKARKVNIPYSMMVGDDGGDFGTFSRPLSYHSGGTVSLLVVVVVEVTVHGVNIRGSHACLPGMPGEG